MRPLGDGVCDEKKSDEKCLLYLGGKLHSETAGISPSPLSILPKAAQQVR